MAEGAYAKRTEDPKKKPKEKSAKKQKRDQALLEDAKSRYLPAIREIQGPVERYKGETMVLDDYARLLAERGLAQDDGDVILGPTETRDIIQEMLIGSTGPAEEELIVQLLDEADYDDLKIIMSDERNNRVGYPRVKVSKLRRKIQKFRPELDAVLSEWEEQSRREAEAREPKNDVSQARDDRPSTSEEPEATTYYDNYFETEEAAELAQEIINDYKVLGVDLKITTVSDELRWTVAGLTRLKGGLNRIPSQYLFVLDDLTISLSDVYRDPETGEPDRDALAAWDFDDPDKLDGPQGGGETKTMYVYRDKLDETMFEENQMTAGRGKVVTELTITHEVGHGLDDLKPDLLEEFIRKFGNNAEYRKQVLRPNVIETYTKDDREYFAEAYHAYLAGTAPKKIADWFREKFPGRKLDVKPLDAKRSAELRELSKR